MAEIDAAGGEAIANHDDITDFDAAKRLVDSAVDAFGDLHVLVNNAGILRDRISGTRSASCVREHAVAEDAGVVHEHVQVAEGVDGGVDQPLGGVEVGDVVVVGDGLSVRRP